MLQPTDKTLLITHRRCLDGTGSAFVFVKAGGKRENVRFRLPTECLLKPWEVVGFEEVWFVDLCPTHHDVPGLIADDVAGGLPFTVVDHHMTNVRRFEGDPRCVFSLEHSGTSLLAREVGLKGHERLVKALEAYDLGRFHDADGTMLADLASTYEQDEMLDLLLRRITRPEGFDYIDGHPVLDNEASQARADAVEDLRKDWAKRCAATAHLTLITSPDCEERLLTAIAVCPPYWTNAVSEAVLAREDFRWGGVETCCEVAVCVDPNGGQVSLRSRPDGPDCSRIAEGYGGGGHPRAAGFRASGVKMLNALAREALG